MLRHALIGLALLFAAAPVYGQDVKLQWKFKEGEKFWVEDVTKTKQTITLALLPQPQKIEQLTTTISSYTVAKVGADSVVLVMKIEDVKVDSKGDLGGEMDKIMEKTKGGTLTVTLTPAGKVTKLEGFDAFLKQIMGEDDLAGMLKDLIKEEAFTKTIEQSFAFVPDKAITKGESWNREGSVPLGPLGDFKTTYTYTYTGKGQGGEQIDVKQAMQYVPPKGDFAGIFKVTKGDMKVPVSKGTLVFDVDKGRLVSATSAMQARGNLTIDVAGQEAQLELAIESNSTSRVLDKMPGKN